MVTSTSTCTSISSSTDASAEAVVSNGDIEGGYELIHQMQDDDQCREALNSVIYWLGSQPTANTALRGACDSWAILC